MIITGYLQNIPMALQLYSQHSPKYLSRYSMERTVLEGESHGLVVKGEDSQLGGCGFEPRPRILDGVSEASFYNGKREIKVAKWGTPKKYFKRTV